MNLYHPQYCHTGLDELNHCNLDIVIGINISHVARSLTHHITHTLPVPGILSVCEELGWGIWVQHNFWRTLDRWVRCDSQLISSSCSKYVRLACSDAKPHPVNGTQWDGRQGKLPGNSPNYRIFSQSRNFFVPGTFTQVLLLASK